MWAILAALLPCCAAWPTSYPWKHLEATALLEEKARRHRSSANLRSKFLRGTSRELSLLSSNDVDQLFQADPVSGSTSGASVPGEVATLKEDIAKLRADKNGLVLTVRRLLKANQTEAQRKIVKALRSVKMKEQAVEKKLKETQLQDNLQFGKLQLLLKATEERLQKKTATQARYGQDMEKLQKLLKETDAQLQEKATMQSQANAQIEKLQKLLNHTEEELAKTEMQDSLRIEKLQRLLGNAEAAESATRAKNEEQVTQKEKLLELNMTELEEENMRLEDEKHGLQETVRKLWNVNAPADTKAVLKALKQEEEQLQVVNSTKQTEEKKFAEEKSALSQRALIAQEKEFAQSQEFAKEEHELYHELNDTEHKYEVDVQAMKTLQGDNQQLRSLLQNQSVLEASVKNADGLKEENQQLKAIVSKERQNVSDVLDVSKANQVELQAMVLERERLKNATLKQEADNQALSKELERVNAIKDSDDRTLVQQLADVQKKVNDSQTQIQLKDQELHYLNISSEGMKLSLKKHKKQEAALRNELANATESKQILEEKVAKLVQMMSEKDDEVSALRRTEAATQEKLKQEEAKLVNAVDTVLPEIVGVEKLKASNKSLSAKLRELEPQLRELQKKDASLQAANLDLMSKEKHEQGEREKLQKELELASKKVLAERTKLDFVVGEENTEMVAVKLLESKNEKIEASFMNRTAALDRDEEMLRRVNVEETAKDAIIKNLIDQNATAQEKIKALEGRFAKIAKVNEWLKDRYKQEEIKLATTADREETESLALRLAQGNNKKLKDELERMTDMEANVEQMAKANQAKATATDHLMDEGVHMKRQLAQLRERDEALRRRNEELQETVVTMVSKNRDDQVQSILRAQAETDKKPARIDSLEQASQELSKLQVQLQSHQQAQETTDSDKDPDTDEWKPDTDEWKPEQSIEDIDAVGSQDDPQDERFRT